MKIEERLKVGKEGRMRRKEYQKLLLNRQGNSRTT